MTPNTTGPGEPEELETDSTAAGLPDTPAVEPAAGADITNSDKLVDVPVGDLLDSDVPEVGSEEPAESDPVEEPVADIMDSDVPEAGSEEPAEAEPETMAEALAQDPNVPGFKRGEVIDGTVISTSPTSVMVDIGGKGEGIIPGRELERMNRETLDTLKPGTEIAVYVVNPHDVNGNVILSVNRALEELDWRKAEEFRGSQQVY
ncbi:MAG: S1 RNA-binding domain-containing protein, partial [Anaerolineae bacterium]|nr:S1 RNA-binding domain-containing protein [Anaerolineae bacterium]